MTIKLGKGSASPQPSDTVAYIQQQILKQWGASSPKLINSSGPSLAASVAAGSLDYAGGPVSAFVDAHLMIFGPSQSRLDYLMVAKPSITSAAALKGKTVALAQPGDEDDVLLSQVLSQNGIPSSSVHRIYTGGYPAVLTAFITGKVDAAFVHAADEITIQQRKTAFHILDSAAKIAPNTYDSVIAAQPQWIKSHESIATAIDLAWLYAAKIANTDSSLWIKDATAYVNGAFPASYVNASYAAYKATGAWPASASAFTASALQQNYQEGVKSGSVKLTGESVNQYATFQPWDAAVKLFQAHPDLFS